jgi:uracil-DNA glycosylase
VRAVRAHVEEAEASGAWGASLAPKRASASTQPAGLERAPHPRGVGRAQDGSNASSPSSGASAPRSDVGGPASAPPNVVPTPGAERERAVPSGPLPVERPGPRGALRGEVQTRLAVLAEETRSCTRCGLHQGRRQAVFARGTGASGLVFVGEGPGEEEDRQGHPFVGPAGQLLDRMIAAMELGRDDVYVCNIVKCRPPKNRKPEPDEMSACMPFLAEQLSLLEPRVIVALGATAVQGLLGSTDGITRIRGQWKLYRGQIPVMPTFHPAYLLRTPAAKRDVWKDLQEVLRRMRDAGPPA